MTLMFHSEGVCTQCQHHGVCRVDGTESSVGTRLVVAGDVDPHRHTGCALDVVSRDHVANGGDAAEVPCGRVGAGVAHLHVLSHPCV
eukprot:CAMPEP_0175901160 /NCGR_PEP_ID=MMETSP0108-20121206/2719_1 /TAXON_ID=195067 ORGANISM="Goniomonas pacifica, Strain CCMP1869" /NCGR_SAMPLE_ID=MMETSP0108 /ASSEMBLY_ACC=CAM_ASM_000204 /LENGTH=86 /DNA_ID=CAMNT_0017222735 /DNA_START=40 /DNA_END=296 /DNA_ORIENTATION=-